METNPKLFYTANIHPHNHLFRLKEANHMKLPFMVRVRQEFDTHPVSDIAAAVKKELAGINMAEIIAPGETVAITAGSRGIANIAAVLAALVDELKQIGAVPFIFPAMGSHGGATAQGQTSLLAHYGITEKAMGVPIRSSMEVVRVGTTPDGIQVFLDKNASKADHTVVVNRVKPHTDFRADLESGLFKMMAIGMGKQKGADHYHNVILEKKHFPVFLSVGREILKQCKVAFGLGLVENQKEETQIIAAVRARAMEEKEKELLKQAKAMFPSIPFSPVDLLIIDWMGKEISGTGMDQNVIGRSVIPFHSPARDIEILRIFVRDLTDDSEGNATAIGNADFTTKRLVDKYDRTASYMNAITSNSPEAVRIPIYFDTDKQAVEAALTTIGEKAPQDARVVHIRSTLALEEMYVSESMQKEALDKPGIRVLGQPAPMRFDPDGTLISDL